MTDCKSVFLDTAPFIYLLDENERYIKQMQSLFDQFASSGVRMVTSVVTAEEYLIFPLRRNNTEKVSVFFEFCSDCDIQLVPVSLETAVKAAAIRAKYSHFKSMDALQLAVAVTMGCDIFLTNDKHLKQFDEINCCIIDEMID